MAAPEPLLVTERMRLRHVTAADADLLVALDADPEVMHFITGGRTTPREEVVDDVLPAFLAHYERWTWYGFFLAHARADGEFLGWFHLRPHGDDDDPELGYRLRRAAWGRGLASEGAQALVDLAFDRAGAARRVGRGDGGAHGLAAGDGAVRDARGPRAAPGVAGPHPRRRARRRAVRDHP